ncbi:MAG: alginate export family protein [Phycisphaerales bacterium]
MNHLESVTRKGKPAKRRRSGSLWMLAASAVFVTTTGVDADVAVETASPVTTVSAEELNALPPRSVDDILKTLVEDGKVSLNIRGRAEIADQDGLETSQAYTVRTRLGFTTGEFNGLSFHIDMEDIRAADYDLYNAAGLNDQPNKTVIADPEDTELNQLYANLKLEDCNSSVRFGRQRIQLDDDRFIGNVGWRQNEQTFDAVRVDSALCEHVDLTYAYLWDVNRIFGPDADRDFESDSHVINLSYDEETLGKITGFAYLLDFEDESTAAANSSDTYGLRYEATRNLKGDPEGPKLNYVLSWATQSDAGDNPTSYDADYYLIDVKYLEKSWYAGVGYEVLGSDDGNAGFRTPLATGHAFNGWADVFLVTPDDGLEDLYVYVGGDLPAGIKGKAVYHWFDPNEGSADFGEEIDLVASKKLSENAELLAKYAYYNGDGAFADITRFWLQLTLNY